ncbi:MAG: epoxyqueuosine reductase QueH [Patescibacteria group bacterium]|jgi:predicted adenine nucleotide alpha hydrolase (AANH) superfamily ATPase|nr:epoxyqueuosine reductase QueH [Patescibacteria group bacterium]
MFKKNKPTILLHACCAGCASQVIEFLKPDFDITVYFYNPNIQPKEEYNKRLQDIRKICLIYNIKLIEGEYEIEKWLGFINGHELDVEGGERCNLCFKFRLEKTVQQAKKLGFKNFTTTLSISPHKNFSKIKEIGLDLESKYDIIFYSADFKKQDGFKKSLELSQKYNLYRQNYCGCVFSLNK